MLLTACLRRVGLVRGIRGPGTDFIVFGFGFGFIVIASLVTTFKLSELLGMWFAGGGAFGGGSCE